MHRAADERKPMNTTVTVLQNFIDGEWMDAADGCRPQDGYS
jgi:hypothetical protein